MAISIYSPFNPNKSRTITPSEHGNPEYNYYINNSQEFTFKCELVINLELYIYIYIYIYISSVKVRSLVQATILH